MVSLALPALVLIFQWHIHPDYLLLSGGTMTIERDPGLRLMEVSTAVPGIVLDKHQVGKVALSNVDYLPGDGFGPVVSASSVVHVQTEAWAAAHITIVCLANSTKPGSN